MLMLYHEFKDRDDISYILILFTDNDVYDFS